MKLLLVGGSNPFENYYIVKMGNIPRWDKHNNYLKPPPRLRLPKGDFWFRFHLLHDGSDLTRARGCVSGLYLVWPCVTLLMAYWLVTSPKDSVAGRTCAVICIIYFEPWFAKCCQCFPSKIPATIVIAIQPTMVFLWGEGSHFFRWRHISVGLIQTSQHFQLLKRSVHPDRSIITSARLVQP